MDDIDTVQAPSYETPTFDPRGAFSWTLRAGEIARLEAQRRRNGLARPETATTGRRETRLAPTPRYETPTFDPRGAFSWTLRAGEVAGRRLREQQAEPLRLAVAA